MSGAAGKLSLPFWERVGVRGEAQPSSTPASAGHPHPALSLKGEGSKRV